LILYSGSDLKTLGDEVSTWNDRYYFSVEGEGSLS
jgi:hypothetical protein